MPSPVNRPFRFVVLHHIVGPGFSRTAESHLDWMFEQSKATSLLTFSTTEVGSWDSAFELKAFSLPDHRSIYLDYEGPIGHDRGAVQQVIAGTFAWLENHDDRKVMNLQWSKSDEANLGEPKSASVRFQRISLREDPGSCETWSVSFLPGL
ncbi:hypothetical protein Pla22_10770 [Rubripirellula amarantea]|uniref:Uncharacterized protein n=1 Tax=Rubripirellula amarantea TaxID=2527999 RepID=A0A5C5WSF9_9BACT|nr:hypothetical protein [Rubripirellula amarantea]TWT53448.1 hypothetical protein Pla22_10770 [Rubripirellula amarantea]